MIWVVVGVVVALCLIGCYITTWNLIGMCREIEHKISLIEEKVEEASSRTQDTEYMCRWMFQKMTDDGK